MYPQNNEYDVINVLHIIFLIKCLIQEKSRVLLASPLLVCASLTLMKNFEEY